MSETEVDLSRLPARERRRQETVLASLPRSFRPGSGPGSIVALDGSRSDWVDQLVRLVGTPIAGVFVTPPTPVSGTAPALLERVDLPVAVDSHWAGHPGWRSVATALAQDASEASLVDVLTIQREGGPGTVGAALLEQLRILDRLHVATTELEAVLIDVHVGGHQIVTRVAGPMVNLVSILGPTARLAIRVVSESRRWTIESTRPAPTSRLRITRVGRDGAWQPPEVHGSSTRDTWRSLRTGSGHAETGSMHALLRAMARLEALTSEDPECPR